MNQENPAYPHIATTVPTDQHSPTHLSRLCSLPAQYEPEGNLTPHHRTSWLNRRDHGKIQVVVVQSTQKDP